MRWLSLLAFAPLVGCVTEAPGPTQSVDLGGFGAVTGLALDGSRLVAVQEDVGVHLLDVGTPGAATLLGSLTASVAGAVDADAGLAAVLDGSGCRVLLLDILGATSPAQVGEYVIGAPDYFGECDGVDVALLGTTLYVAVHLHPVRIVDVTDPAAPTLVGTLAEAESIAAASGGRVSGVGLDFIEGFLFTAAGGSSVSVATDFGYTLEGFDATDEHAVVTGSDGVFAYDLTGPTPLVVATFDEPTVAFGEVSIEGEVIAVALPYDGRVGYLALGAEPTLGVLDEVRAPGVGPVVLGPDAAYAGAERQVHVLPRP